MASDTGSECTYCVKGKKTAKATYFLPLFRSDFFPLFWSGSGGGGGGGGLPKLFSEIVTTTPVEK